MLPGSHARYKYSVYHLTPYSKTLMSRSTDPGSAGIPHTHGTSRAVQCRTYKAAPPSSVSPPAVLPAVVHDDAPARVGHGSPFGGDEDVWVLIGGQRTAQQLLVRVRAVQVCWGVSG